MHEKKNEIVQFVILLLLQQYYVLYGIYILQNGTHNFLNKVSPSCKLYQKVLLHGRKKNFAENGYYVPDEPISLTYHYNSIYKYTILYKGNF